MSELENKPLYVTSYIKQLAAERSGTKSIDKSVFDEVQNAILAVFDRGFRVKGGKAYLNPPESGSSGMDEPSPPTKISFRSQFRDDLPVVLVKVVNGMVLSDHSDIVVEVIDLDRIGRMLGNPAYDTEVRMTIETLRRVAPKIKNFDCNHLADEFEAIHSRGRL